MKLIDPVKRKRQIGIGITLFVLGTFMMVYLGYKQVNDTIFTLLQNQVEIHVNSIFSERLERINSYYPKLDKVILNDNREALLVEEKNNSDDRFISAPLWTSHSEQTTTSHYVKKKLENVFDQTVLSWSEGQRLYAAKKLTFNKKSFWLVEIVDKNYFATHWQDFLRILTIFSLIQMVLIYLAIKLALLRTTGPIQSIRQGIEKVKESDYQYEYLGHSIPEVDQLGQSVTDVVRYLGEDRNDLISGQQQYSLLLENINLGVLVIDSHGKIDLMNPALEEILGLSPTVIGRPYQTVLKSFQLISLINRVMHTHSPIQEEVEVYVPSSKFLDVNILSYREFQASEMSFLVLLYDITEIRRLETVRSEFVANASHELRTPVTAIKGFAETLLNGALKEKKAAYKFVNIIAKESNRLEVIIDDILELSRVEKNENILPKTNFDVNNVTENMIEFLSQKIAQKSISVELISESDITLKADQHRFEQILTNLLDNAINYSDEGSKITITIKKKKKSIEIIVSDTGIGIPEKEIERIFERFYRVDKARSRNSGGTGLGLSIVRNLVMLMDGKIEVESQVGVGTSFSITFPN
ncbi:two-component system histidine kinase PnpS [Facklamia miroungae]|uniref:histidine kinase n=1 Tax=Facklamia miroungae TaxID=120956 RepID=A0A1G7SG02_9LACT|nr:ATP-binding protein [Facklamia miroungae]NKZ29663.1 PAS domain S-box protein [Facklamia miroungae]SDG22007.1 two-component system, OmpR family, phosphate regulon sensor histidine kinase PhoR [Facklamia miroungae]